MESDLGFHHNQEGEHGVRKQTISWQRKCVFHSFGTDPRVILESWLAGPLDEWEGPPEPGPLHLQHLDLPGVLPGGPGTFYLAGPLLMF